MGTKELFAPATIGDWLGANGPATATVPDWKERVDWILGLGVNIVRLNTHLAWYARPAYLPHCLTMYKYIIDNGGVPLPVMGGSIDGFQNPGNQTTNEGLAILQQRLIKPFLAMFDAGVRAIEGPNEWDGPGVKGVVDVPRTVEVSRILYETWHVVGEMKNTRVLCIGGGTSTLAPTGVKAVSAPGAFPPGTTEGQLFAPLAWKSFMSLRGGLSFDAPAHHAGAYPFDPHTAENRSKPWNGFWQTATIANDVQKVLPGQRVWVTEIPHPEGAGGFSTEKAAADRAGQDLMRMVEMMGRGLVGPVLSYHGCRDDDPGHDNSHRNGLRRSNGNEKPTANVWRQYAAVKADPKWRL